MVAVAFSSRSELVPTLEREDARGFAALDEALSLRSGVLVARVASAAAGHALIAHVRRRATLLGLSPLHAAGGMGASVWSDVSARLHGGKLEGDPARAAAQILESVRSRRALVVAPLPSPGSWDRVVAAELAQLEPSPCVVLVADPDDQLDGFARASFDVTSDLDDTDKARFFSAIADAARRTLPYADLSTLESWWEASRRISIDARVRATALSAPVSSTLAALALAGRAWPVQQGSLLKVDFEAAEQAGVITLDNGWASIEPAWAERAEAEASIATSQTRCRVAGALERTFDGDAHALIRAAEVLVAADETGDTTAAEALYGRALASVTDAHVRREVVSRWASAIDARPVPWRAPLRMAAAERALAAGEAEEAFRWAKAAAQATTDSNATLLVGRSAVALGDLVTAKAALNRAAATANDDETRSLVSLEVAEIAYLAGDHGLAKTEAELTLGRTGIASTRLRARNMLGKLLLASSAWEEAEAHFAADALEASAAKDVTAELRARVNRGVALLSQRRLDEARNTFETVLVQAESTGDGGRACAFALDNLAIVAMWRHEYGLALELFERTLKIRQRIGDRMATARVLTNLAELRRKLGLLDHAEHAAAFGRQQLGPGMPKAVSRHFCMVLARVALSRGNTALAHREIARAIADDEAAGTDQYNLGMEYRVATRAALDDGDLGRAEAMLVKAREVANRSDLAMMDEAHGEAEVAILEVAIARARGTASAEMAAEAVTLARAAGEEELLREAHVLAFEVHRAGGEHGVARMHLEQAVAVRDAVAATLSGDVKAAFLGRAEITALGKLASLVSDAPPRLDDEEGPRTQRSPRAATKAREMVGDDPAIRGLMLAIRRVARTGSTVLIHGESGTGKELVAEAVHRASDRANGPLITVNCAALVETLLLSELFGHEKGSFTGAAARRRGRFELAEGGTLFLDEIGDISPRTQVALLRVLQERTFERVGGTASIRADVRIVCATHRDLKAMVDRGEFREDLYYRLRGISLEVPALRNRLGDLARISEHLLDRIAEERGEVKKGLSLDAIELLCRHRWAGNIRELDNVLRAVSLFAEGAVITAQDLTANVDELRALSTGLARPASVPPPSLVEISQASLDIEAGDEGEGPLPPGEAGPTAVAYACVRQGSVSLSDLKRQIERDCIARALAETRGNITKAAALLGMKRPRLSQLVKQYGLAAVSMEPQ